MPDILRIINTDDYPIDRLGSVEAIKWLSVVKNQLDEEGSCLFPGFIKPDALSQMVKEAKSVCHLAFPGPAGVTPYFFNYRLGEGQQLAESHPLKRIGKRKLSQVAADLIPDSFLLSLLFHSTIMPEFLASIIGQPVFQNADPYQSLNISVMDEGGCQQWHFDSGPMVTTLLLQDPEAGGEFEYVPAIRSDENENFDAVQAILDGDSKPVRKNRLKAGTLSLFRGHYSLHRVTTVTGSRQRLQAILGYTTNPGFVGSKESSILHYGPRVAEIENTDPRYPGPDVA